MSQRPLGFFLMPVLNVRDVDTVTYRTIKAEAAKRGLRIAELLKLMVEEWRAQAVQ